MSSYPVNYNTPHQDYCGNYYDNYSAAASARANQADLMENNNNNNKRLPPFRIFSSDRETNEICSVVALVGLCGLTWWLSPMLFAVIAGALGVGAAISVIEYW